MTGSARWPLPSHSLRGVFERFDPVQLTPVIIDLPQSGTEYPATFDAVAPFRSIHAHVSMHVDDLY